MACGGHSREKGTKRIQLSSRESVPAEEEDIPPGRHMRAAGEQRSKAREDTRLSKLAKHKAPAHEESPPPRKKSAVVDVSDDDDEDVVAEEGEDSGNLKEQSWR